MTNRSTISRRRAHRRARTAALAAAALLAAGPLAACERGTNGAGTAKGGAATGQTADAPGASAFHACLTGKGVESRIDEMTGAVALRIPKESMPPEMRQAVEGFDDQAPEGGAEGEEMVMTMNDAGDGSGPLMSAFEGEDMWSIYKDATTLEADHPDLAEPYAACEAEFPDFAQPDVHASMTEGMDEYRAQALEDTRAAARCGHANGHAWVRDPDDEFPALIIPSGVSEEDVRAFAQQCVPQDAMVSWGTDGDIDFDLSDALDGLGGAGMSVETKDGE